MPDTAASIEQVETFARLHAHELLHPDELDLSAEQQESFVSLCPHDTTRPNLELRIARSLRLEAQEIIELIAASEEPPLILDCGSGWGTQALFFALLGARIVGVELLADRVEIARARLEWFRKQTDQPLDVEFVAGNIFPVLEEHRCEIVWACQAISHIHPAEDFLQQLFRAMPTGGTLILSDANWHNPQTRLQLYRQFWRVHKKLRWYSHSRYTDPQTGEAVEMAEERVFSPRGLAKLMRAAGFDVTSVRTRGFLPVFRLSAGGDRPGMLSFLDRIDASISNIPLIGKTGSMLVAVGRKGDHSE